MIHTEVRAELEPLAPGHYSYNWYYVSINQDDSPYMDLGIIPEIQASPLEDDRLSEVVYEGKRTPLPLNWVPA